MRRGFGRLGWSGRHYRLFLDAVLLIAHTVAAFIHPYDDDRVIAGQATCAKELLEDIADLDLVIAPVGGGGLLSGTCLTTHAMRPSAVVYAAEPAGAADAVLSLASGQVERASYVKTIADGLLTTLSPRTLAIIREHVRGILLVSDAEILAALRLVYERMKIVIKPSSVVTVAAGLKHPEIFASQRVGLIVSGGNVDLTTLAECLQS